MMGVYQLIQHHTYIGYFMLNTLLYSVLLWVLAVPFVLPVAFLRLWRQTWLFSFAPLHSEKGRARWGAEGSGKRSDAVGRVTLLDSFTCALRALRSSLFSCLGRALPRSSPPFLVAGACWLGNTPRGIPVFFDNLIFFASSDMTVGWFSKLEYVPTYK